MYLSCKAYSQPGCRPVQNRHGNIRHQCASADIFILHFELPAHASLVHRMPTIHPGVFRSPGRPLFLTLFMLAVIVATILPVLQAKCRLDSQGRPDRGPGFPDRSEQGQNSLAGTGAPASRLKIASWPA
jgi:hypothetical protein